MIKNITNKRSISGTLRITLVLLSCMYLLGSCTGLSKLSEGEYLVTNNKLIISDKNQIENYKKVKQQFQDEIKPKPNGKFLWMRPRLAIHNSFSEPKKEKGFKNWLKYKLGQKPVLLDETVCQNLNLTFENLLYHMGHFNATATYEMDIKNKAARITFFLNPKQSYKIDTLLLPETNDSLSAAIRKIHHDTFIKRNTTYNLELLINERQRIDQALKDHGYFYFDQEYLLFLADTTKGDHRVIMKLAYKFDMPVEAQKVYKIEKVIIAEDFKLDNYHPDTVHHENFSIVSATNYMKPKIFLNSILSQKGDIYSKTKHNNSLRQLTGLRSYKFVNAKYAPSSGFNDKLDVSYLMTPSQRMSLSAEINAVSKSNNFVGPGLILSYKSKNTLRGAELFSLNLRGRFEKQVSGEKEGDTAYEIGVDASIDMPGLIPFKLRKINKPYAPNSSITIGTGIYSRVSLYRFNTYTTGLEYTWRKNDFITHVIRPVEISYTNLSDASQEFKKFLLLNPSIRQSFEEQFIIGMSYNFIINKLAATNKYRYYINAGVDPSGNLASIINGIVSNADEEDKQFTLFGTPISQYFRIRTDFRYYFKTGKESLIATRLYAGVGIPYGNSKVMPYIKQFYAGGTNSLRAFRARSVGPGSYITPDSLENVLIDQTGEIKLETNIEYRFPIVGFLKGALFSDIGNVWLVNEDSLRPGGKFDLDYFHKQLAVGIGFGLRVDIDLVVIRFDWAIPVRKPWLPEGERWVFNEIDLFNRRWRKDNLLWNISIGYPF